MEVFLEKVSNYLLSSYKDNLSDLCIVLPNNRAGLFLKRYLSQSTDVPIWLPEVMGTESFMERLSDFEIIDNIEQLFELYQVYKELVTDPEDFEEFIKWGQILLHDFNEIDRYHVPTDKFFRHVNEVRAMEVWNVDGQEISDFQKQYLQFWKQMGELYQLFTKRLKEKKKAYQGLAYRTVAEQIKENTELFIDTKITWGKVVFVGFNALNKAEEIIVRNLKKMDKCDILFDADEYYMKDEYQESGLFLRKWKSYETFQPFNWISNKFKSEEKEINLYGIPQNIGQAKYLPKVMTKIDGTKGYTNTAVVLSDENLLIPVLQSIPEEVRNINVTMGYALRNTPLNNFFEILFAALINAERFGNSSNLTYHHKDLLKLFRQPMSEAIFTKPACEEIINKITLNNWVFINKEKLEWINSRINNQIKSSVNVEDLLELILHFIEQAKRYHSSKEEKDQQSYLELEYLFKYAQLFNQIKLLLSEFPFMSSIKSFYLLYTQLLSSYNIDLYGEPLKGLQVLGMLETRNVDFENVIILSANEGVLPQGKSFNSFIPFDLKKAYQLPTHIEKDAIYAYHFYRLVQNARQVNIFYNTETNEFGSGEQSRFITQMENELSNYDNINITKQLISYPIEGEKQLEKKVAKTDKVKSKIKHLFEKGVSPTALITYLNCPLDFYYKYVLGVRVEKEVEEVIDHSAFGSYIHKSLELLYENLIGKKITDNDLSEVLGRVPKVVTEVFSKDYHTSELQVGKNLLTINAAQNYITTFVKNELSSLKHGGDDVVLVSLEERLQSSIWVDGNEVLLKGVADRIDRINGTLRVIDYKTGWVGPSELNLKSIDDAVDVKRSKAFQLLMYAYLNLKNPETMDVSLSSGIVSFRSLSKGFMPVKVGQDTSIGEQVVNEFELLIEKVIKEVLDVNKHFEHSSESSWCEFCCQTT